jgi:hypothetical protein
LNDALQEVEVERVDVKDKEEKVGQRYTIFGPRSDACTSTYHYMVGAIRWVNVELSDAHSYVFSA